MTAKQRQLKLVTYQAANEECAANVLADPAECGGETALLVQWARAVIANASGKTAGAKDLPLWSAA